MSVVKINAINVPEGRGADLEARFAKRAGEVDKLPGFEHFELLRPVEGDARYFVYTRWESEDAYQAWVSSRQFGESHARPEGNERPVAQGADLLAFEVVDFG